MNKAQKIKLVGIKTDLARLPDFNDECYVHNRSSDKRGMTFHHLWYLPGEKDFIKILKPGLEYYEFLDPLIRDNPNRFLYVTNSAHQLITRLKWLKAEKFERLVQAVRMTR